MLFKYKDIDQKPLQKNKISCFVTALWCVVKRGSGMPAFICIQRLKSKSKQTITDKENNAKSYDSSRWMVSVIKVKENS